MREDVERPSRQPWSTPPEDILRDRVDVVDSERAQRESEFLLYSAPDGPVKVGVLFRDETAWITRRALAALFGVKVPAITKHLKNSPDSGG
jgi:hypothetical protein